MERGSKENNEKKIYAIEAGSFARSLRNSVQRPVTIDQWRLFYAQMDEPVSEIWLRSLRDVARVAFGCKLEEPTKVCCSDQLGELQSKMIDNITPSTQLMKVFSQLYSMAADLEKGSEEWPVVDAIEMQALLQVVNAAAKFEKGYEGSGVYAELRGADKEVVKKAAVPWTGEAFFATHLRTGKLGARYLAKAQCGDKENIRNLSQAETLSQAIAKASAVPTHHTVLINQAELSLQLFENLTNRLCLMYYNVPNAVRVPAPVLYATKIAAFCGNVVKKPSRPRLLKQIKVSAQGRYNAIVSHGQKIKNQLRETLNAWGCQLGSPAEPLEVEAERLETLQ
ncbi:PIWIL2, partial [Symbiodinium necroappetens]